MTESNGLANADDLFRPGVVRRYDEATLPILGKRVRIQSLTEREVSAYQSALYNTGATGLNKNRMQDAQRRLIVLCLVDAAGNRLLNESHIARLADWDAADSLYLYTECARHTGINKSDVEDLIKNSEGAPVAVSPSA